MVENPYPDDQVTGIQIVKTAEDAGDIFLINFAVRQSLKDNALVRACEDSNRESLISPVI